MSYLKMLLVAHVHLYRQNRLLMNLHDLNKISDFEFAKCAQTLAKKQDLPPVHFTNDSGVA